MSSAEWPLEPIDTSPSPCSAERVLFDLIFDLDDTLIASFEAYSDCHRRVAGVLGWPQLEDADLVIYDRDFPSTLTRHYPGRDVSIFIETWRREMVAFPTAPIAGVAAALLELRARGHHLWVVTSRAREHLALRMQQGGLDEAWFDGVFAFDDQPAPKPDPRCFEPVWRRCRPTGVAHKPALYVGDRGGDGEAAQAAGIAFVAVRTGPEVRHGFPSGLRERDVLDDVTQLVQWLDTHGESVASEQLRALSSVLSHE